MYPRGAIPEDAFGNDHSRAQMILDPDCQQAGHGQTQGSKCQFSLKRTVGGPTDGQGNLLGQQGVADERPEPPKPIRITTYQRNNVAATMLR